MRVFVSADVEGVTGVTHPQDVIPGRSQYERFRRFLTANVNAAIRGAARGGATEFLVNEAHDGTRSVLLEDLDDYETAFEMFMGVLRMAIDDLDYE